MIIMIFRTSLDFFIITIPAISLVFHVFKNFILFSSNSYV